MKLPDCFSNRFNGSYWTQAEGENRRAISGSYTDSYTKDPTFDGDMHRLGEIPILGGIVGTARFCYGVSRWVHGSLLGPLVGPLVDKIIAFICGTKPQDFSDYYSKMAANSKRHMVLGAKQALTLGCFELFKSLYDHWTQPIKDGRYD